MQLRQVVLWLFCLFTSSAHLSAPEQSSEAGDTALAIQPVAVTTWQCG